MVKLWAEKETRNLKRIYSAGIPSPKPLYLQMHVLVMEFLGDESGWPSPRLKDADIQPEEYPKLYFQLLAYMRIMYQQCRLVHADLSEYNILYHNSKLYIIDVSQSVEHDHPHSLEFLRMDIKNVNDYFRRQGVQPFSERRVFQFITASAGKGDSCPETAEFLIGQLTTMPQEELTDKDQTDDAVFREVYIPQNLEQVYDIERDTQLVDEGGASDLVYRDLLATNKDEEEDDDEVIESDDSSDSDMDSDDDGDVWNEQPKERKFADRDANKERKKNLKAERKEKRKTKMKKSVKKKLVQNSKGKSR
jgi:RIO kinase 1